MLFSQSAGFTLALTPSTTALAAATFVSQLYLARDFPMPSMAPIPTALYVRSHFRTVFSGMRSSCATDFEPRPEANRAAALSLTSLPCLHLRSTDMKKPPIPRTVLSLSKKWEAVHNARVGALVVG